MLFLTVRLEFPVASHEAQIRLLPNQNILCHFDSHSFLFIFEKCMAWKWSRWRNSDGKCPFHDVSISNLIHLHSPLLPSALWFCPRGAFSVNCSLRRTAAGHMCRFRYMSSMWGTWLIQTSLGFVSLWLLSKVDRLVLHICGWQFLISCFQHLCSIECKYSILIQLIRQLSCSLWAKHKNTFGTWQLHVLY